MVKEVRINCLMGAAVCRSNGMMRIMSAFLLGGPDLQLPVATATMGQTLSKGDTPLATFSLAPILQYRFSATGWKHQIISLSTETPCRKDMSVNLSLALFLSLSLLLSLTLYVSVCVYVCVVCQQVMFDSK